MTEIKHFPSLNEQMDLIRRGAFEIIPEDELVRKIEKSIKTKEPLKIKLPDAQDFETGIVFSIQPNDQDEDPGG